MPVKSTTLPVLLACVLVNLPGLAPGVAAAEEPDFAAMSLKELVALDVFTAASLLPTQTSKAPGTVYTFHRNDFKRFGVRRLDDLLAFVPGLQLNQYRKRHRSIWARGMIDRYNDKLVLLVDGVPMRHLYYGHFALGDNLPLEAIEKVEVILGPASSLYGANAFGGLISVTTRAFSEQPEVEVSAELADNQRRKSTIGYSSAQLQAFASYLEQDAPFRADRQSFIGSEVVQPTDERFANLLLKSAPMPGLTLALNYSEDETPYLFIPATQDAYVDEQQLTLSARYEQGTLDTGRIETTLYYQNDKAREYEIEQVTRRLGYEEHQNAEMAGATLIGLQRWGAQTLAAGVSWQHETARETDYERSFHFRDGFLSPTRQGDLLSEPGISNDNYALFVQDVWDISPTLSLTLGARYDAFEQFDDYVNYRGALVYTPDAQQTWKVQYGTAIRTPTLREYLKVLEGTSFVAPDVEAERIRLAELGYLYQWDQANLSLNLYQSQVSDFIYEVPTPDRADEYFTNSSEQVRMRGAEALLSLRPADALHVRLGLAYLDSDLSGVALPYLARWSSSLNVDYTLNGRHTLGFSVLHNSHRSDLNAKGEDEAEAFATVNLFASGPLSPEFSYALGVDNLFDQRVFDPAADFGSQYNVERSEREIWLRLQWSPKR